MSTSRFGAFVAAIAVSIQLAACVTSGSSGPGTGTGTTPGSGTGTTPGSGTGTTPGSGTGTTPGSGTGTTPGSGTGSGTSGLETDTDRPGSDYKTIDLPSADPALCFNACTQDTGCSAFTYVKPGVQAAGARCWLKVVPPASKPDACCVSGVVRPMPPGSMESNVDRPGSDLRSFDLLSPDPGACRDACGQEAACRAFTYVRPGVQGPSARCWLKNAVPGATRNDCCVSGVKP